MRTKNGSFMTPRNIGLCLVAFGIVLFIVSFWFIYETNRITSLPVLSQAMLSDSRPGREAVVEGQIRSSRSGLIAYWHERRIVREHRNEDGDIEERIIWKMGRVVTPPLSIQTARGIARIRGGSGTNAYKLYNTKQSQTGPDDRYYGFRANDMVMAVGVVAQGSGGMVLNAEFVYGGTQESYAQSQGTIGILFFLGGIAALAAGGVVLSRWFF